MSKQVDDFISESIKVKEELLGNETIEQIAQKVIECFESGNKVLICGNGGSASDAQHFAAELVGRYKIDRKGLAAIALNTDTSIITAIGNDFGYDEIFAKQVEGLAHEGDVIFGISTSGNSRNVINALNQAKKRGLTKIGLIGNTGGDMKGLCDLSIVVPSDNTPRIQEAHIMIIHIICEIVETHMFGKK